MIHIHVTGVVRVIHMHMCMTITVTAAAVGYTACHTVVTDDVM